MEELEETGLTLPEELDTIFETMKLKSDFGFMKTVDTDFFVGMNVHQICIGGTHEKNVLFSCTKPAGLDGDLEKGEWVRKELGRHINGKAYRVSDVRGMLSLSMNNCIYCYEICKFRIKGGHQIFVGRTHEKNVLLFDHGYAGPDGSDVKGHGGT